MECRGRDWSVRYSRVEYVLSAYFSRSSRVVYGFPAAYCSRAAMMRRNQVVLRGSRWDGWVRREERAWARRREMGCAGGRAEKVEVMVSRQNWKRRAAMAGVEAVSGMRAISRLKARRAR